MADDAEYVPVALGVTPTPWGIKVTVEKDDSYSFIRLTPSDAEALVRLLQEALADSKASFEQAFEEIAMEEEPPE